MKKNKRLLEAFEQINTAQNILLVTHNKPDGDALSSMCAFLVWLTEAGKKHTAFCHDEAPPQFDFLPLIENINTSLTQSEFNLFDLIIILDCGSLKRTAIDKKIKNRKKNQIIIEFDHHPRIDNFANLEIRDPKASSTSELIYCFFQANRISFNKKIANCILTGILTDTGNFLYPSTSKKTIKIASKMLLYGAKYPQITKQTWRNKSLASMKLWGKAIARLKINKKYGLAYTILTLEDLKKLGGNGEELEGIAGFLSNLKNIKALLLLREDEGGIIKGNLRTNSPDIDISLLAQKLGGGGHQKASGFLIKAELKKNAQGWNIE